MDYKDIVDKEENFDKQKSVEEGRSLNKVMSRELQNPNGEEQQFHTLSEEPSVLDFETDDNIDLGTFSRKDSVNNNSNTNSNDAHIIPKNTFVSVQSGLHGMPETRQEIISDRMLKDDQTVSDLASSLRTIHNTNAQRQSMLNQQSFQLHKHHIVTQLEQQKSIKKQSRDNVVQSKQIEHGKALLHRVEECVNNQGETQEKVNEDISTVKQNIEHHEIELERVKQAYKDSQQALLSLQTQWEEEEAKLKKVHETTSQSVEEYKALMQVHATQMKTYEQQIIEYQNTLNSTTEKVQEYQVVMKEQTRTIRQMTQDKIRTDCAIDLSIVVSVFLFFRKFFLTHWTNKQVASALMTTYVAIDGQRLQWSKGMLKQRIKYMYWLLLLIETMVGVKTIRKWAITRGYHNNTGDLPEYVQMIWAKLFGTEEKQNTSLFSNIAGTGYAIVAGTYNSLASLFYTVDKTMMGEKNPAEPEK